jgi:hypothetical protein
VSFSGIGPDCWSGAVANKYVRPPGGAYGAEDGSNWSNAHDGMPATLVRGDTYYVADGSYGSYVCDDNANGVLTITVKKATAADHGTETGWDSDFGDGQAVFGSLTIRDPYYIFDGQTRTESHTWTAPAGYGFRCTGSIEADSNDGDDASNCQFRYIDIGPTYNPTYAGPYGYVLRFVYTQHDITFHRCAIHNGNPALLQGAGADNLTFEFCHIGPGFGKQSLRGGNDSLSTGWIIRYNRFWNSAQFNPDDEGAGITGDICIWDSDTGSFDNFKIYGNWIFNDKTGGRNTAIVVGGDGGGWSGVGGTGIEVYNNTIAGIPETSVFPMIDINGSGNSARNNLFYDCVDTDVSAATASDNDVAATDIFVDAANHDYRLAEQTSPGFTLSSPYDEDPNGVTRGSDGTWSVGAFQFGPDAPDDVGPVEVGPRNIRIRGAA